MIDLADRLLRAGETGVLSTLFASRGSTYRTLGSLMVQRPADDDRGGDQRGLP